ncbi:MAG: PocR ligand-binding domain-containing protein [Spirochaetes bacterium]|nr:PocR ligand-binding domain-containing protein [Spirochaetota bacterium]
MEKAGAEISVNEKEIRELLSIIDTLFGIQAGYFHLSETNKRWTVILNRTQPYGPYCQLVRKRHAGRCESSNDDFLEKAKALGKPLWYQCYNGLFELYLPLRLGARDAGFLHLAQVRSEKPFVTVARECGLHENPDLEDLRKIYEGLPVVEAKKREMIARLITVFAEQIVAKRLVEWREADPSKLLEYYVEEHLDKDPSIEGAARYVGKSASWVTHTFKKKYARSFRDHLGARRIERARAHLAVKSIAETATLCGFKNRYHFTRVFTRLAGMTPMLFQRSLRKGEKGGN